MAQRAATLNTRRGVTTHSRNEGRLRWRRRDSAYRAVEDGGQNPLRSPGLQLGGAAEFSVSMWPTGCHPERSEESAFRACAKRIPRVRSEWLRYAWQSLPGV